MVGKRARRHFGFTFIEVVVVIGIVGIAAAVAVPSITRMKNKSTIRKQVREIKMNLQRCRVFASRGKTINAGSGGTGNVTRSCGLRPTFNDEYAIFLSDNPNGAGGNEETALIHRFPADTGLRFLLPTSGDIVFRNNGTLAPASPTQVMLADNDGKRYSIDITLTGSMDVNIEH